MNTWKWWNYKEIAGNGEKVDEEIWKIYHLIAEGEALLHKFFSFRKTFGDIIRGYQFHVKTNFTVFTVVFDGYERSWTCKFDERSWTCKKNTNTAIKCRYYCQRRSGSPSHKDDRCWYTKCWGSFRLCMLKNRICRRLIFCTFGTVTWEKFSWKPTKRRIKFKSCCVSERLQSDWILSSSRTYCLYMLGMAAIQRQQYLTRV